MRFFFVSCTISQVGLCLFLESIEHDFIRDLIDTSTPNSDLAQLSKRDLEVGGSIPGKGNFFILFFSFNTGRNWKRSVFEKLECLAGLKLKIML